MALVMKTKRGRFYQVCSERGLSTNDILKMAENMKGLTDEQKEAMAEELTKKVIKEHPNIVTNWGK